MNTYLAVADILVYLLNLVIYLVIAQAILSWLVAFNVINVHNNFVRSVLIGLDRLFEPLLRPIRRALPDFGGIDLSPMVLILGLILMQFILQRVIPGIILDITGP